MPLNFFKLQGSIDPVVNYLSGRLQDMLETGQTVLWLVPGGSSIEVAIAVSQQLSGVDLGKLTVSLTDERYGEVGHADSNWQQLLESGFRLPGANLVPVISSKTMEDTVKDFSDFLQDQLTNTDYCLGFFGIGPDGHTAGILPGSLAISENEMALGYKAGPYQRITMTPKAIKMLDEAVVFALGEDKHTALDNLDKDLTITEQPAQVLKSVNKLSVFNDYKGEVL